MAYSVLATVVTGTPISSTTFGNVIKANFDAAFPLGVDGWTSYTPSLVQLGAVPKTVTYAKYQRVGRMIMGQVKLDVSGAGGTAANSVIVGLPVAAALGANGCIGSGFIYDASANLFYGGQLRKESGDSFSFVPTSTDSATQLGVAVFTAALAASDIVSASFQYEAAT